MEKNSQRCCIRVTVSGKVQGVFFRKSTTEKARTLGLTGWVKNLSSGEVELLACGLQSQLDVFLKWLNVGPPLATVTTVAVETVAFEHHPDFRTIHSERN